MSETNDGRRNNKPPAQHQFKKGQTGNPRGRPKKRPREFSEDQLFRDVLHMSSMTVKVDLGQGKQDYTLQEAMLLRMFTKAANGDNGMIKAAIPLLSQAFARNEESNATVFQKLRMYKQMLKYDPSQRNSPEFFEKLDHVRKYTKPI